MLSMGNIKRKFLNLAGAACIVVALGGLEGIITGCASIPKVSREELKIGYQSSVISSIEDPRDRLRFLHDDEYVVPDKVFNTYVRIVNGYEDNFPEWAIIQAGGYFAENYLSGREINKFAGRLKELNLSEEEISFYIKLFTREDIIILKASELKEDVSFKKFLPHERFHKAMRRLSRKDRKEMMDVAREMIDAKNTDGKSLVPRGNAYVAASQNPEEFYTYLAQGEFTFEVEDVLRKNYPKTYQIFDRIREECRLKE